MVIGLTTKKNRHLLIEFLARPKMTVADYNSWCICNSIIIGWIVSALDP